MSPAEKLVRDWLQSAGTSPNAAETLIMLINGIAERARCDAFERAAQIAEYSIRDGKERQRVAERIRAGMTQHTNTGG